MNLKTKSKLVILKQMRKNCFGSEWAEFALKTKLGAVRAAEGCGKGRHQQKMSSLSRLGAALPADGPAL